MRQTFFTIPPWLFDGPLLVAWLIIGLVILGWLVRRHGWKSESLNFLPVYLVGALLLAFVIPHIQIQAINPADPTGPPVPGGLAVRGYGVMMLLGMLAGVGLSLWRGRQENVDPEQLLTLAFWMAICGIVGARLFYVIQKVDEYSGLSPGEALGKMINVTEGGLVVYGSLIGATAGGGFYLWWSRLPPLKVADIVAPGMVLGLAIGRIGCLMNGCCFGGPCDLPAVAQEFPAGSAPWMRQLQTGELLGFQLVTDEDPDVAAANWQRVESVQAESLAAEYGIRPDNRIRIELPETPLPVDQYIRAEKSGLPTGLSLVIRRLNAPAVVIPFAATPDRSRGVYPTQILAAINATLLAMLLWFYYPFRRYRGRVFGLMLILYSMTRFLLEIIRRDEYGQLGTTLTISQLVSGAMLVIGLGLFLAARQRI